MYRILYPWSFILFATCLILSFDLYKNPDKHLGFCIFVVMSILITISIFKKQIINSLNKNIHNYSLGLFMITFNCGIYLMLSILPLVLSKESLHASLGFVNGLMSSIGMLLIILSISMIYCKFSMLYYYRIVKKYTKGEEE